MSDQSYEKGSFASAQAPSLDSKENLHFAQNRGRTTSGRNSDPIVRYEREYQKEFTPLLEKPSKLKPLRKSQLISEIRRADVTLIADFHTFVQAQRTALRLIRDAIRPGENWCIGIEMVPSHFQADLDRFQAGKSRSRNFTI